MICFPLRSTHLLGKGGRDVDPLIDSGTTIERYLTFVPGPKVVVHIDEPESRERLDGVEAALPEGLLRVRGQLAADNVADPAVEPLARVLRAGQLLCRETVNWTPLGKNATSDSASRHVTKFVQ